MTTFVSFVKDIKINKFFKNTKKNKIVVEKFVKLKRLNKKREKAKITAYKFINVYDTNITQKNMIFNKKYARAKQRNMTAT